jgi:hypothetical protein
VGPEAGTDPLDATGTAVKSPLLGTELFEPKVCDLWPTSPGNRPGAEIATAT